MTNFLKKINEFLTWILPLSDRVTSQLMFLNGQGST
jgi:hypothetical protein